MCRHGSRVDDFRMNIVLAQQNGGGAMNIHSQYGEYVYEHERVGAHGRSVMPCLQKAGTNMQSVMDCWQRTLREVGSA